MKAQTLNKRQAEKVADKQIKIQKEIDKIEKKQKKKEPTKAMQAGAREYPEPPLSKQHLKKPGLEKDLSIKPMYDAPFYKGSEKLQDMVAIITGGDSGIGRAVAVLFAREGADIVIVYLNEHEDAEETKRMVEKEGRDCILISGDVSDSEFCEEAVARTIDKFGKLDVLVNNAAFQQHAKNITEIDEKHLEETRNDKY